MTTEWQVIETAPKDGTAVLVYGGQQDQSVLAYDVRPATMIAIAWFERNEWRFCCYDGGHYGAWENPSYWAPIPLPATWPSPPNRETDS